LADLASSKHSLSVSGKSKTESLTSLESALNATGTVCKMKSMSS